MALIIRIFTWHNPASVANSRISARTWQRVCVIVGVLALAVIVAGANSPLIAAATVALPIAVVGVITLLHKPFLGPLVLIVTGLVVNLGTPDNLNPTILMLLFLSGLWLFDMLVRKELLPANPSRAVRPLLLLIGVAFLAFVVGQLPWFPVPSAPLEAQVGGVAVYALSACAFLMVLFYVKDLKWLQWMVWLLILIGSLYVFARILPRPFRYLIAFYPWGSTSCLFWLWLAAHTFSQLLLNRTLGFLQRALLISVLVATLYAVGVQTFDWKSGWIPVLVAMAAIVGLRWPRLLVIMGVAGLIVGPFAIANLITGDEYSYSTRVDAWLIMLKIIQANPIIGLGPSNYYWYSSLFAIRGYGVNFNSHNQYIDLIAQTGLVGLICYLWFFAEVGRIGWRLRHRVQGGFAKAYLYGSLGGLCGMLVAGVLGDWVLPFVYNVGLVGMRSSTLGWLFLGGLVALETIYGQLPNQYRAAPQIEATPTSMSLLGKP